MPPLPSVTAPYRPGSLQNLNRSTDHDSMRGSSMFSDPDPIVRHGRTTTRSARKWILAVLALAAGVAAALMVPKPLPELSRAEFLAEVRGGHARKITIVDGQVITGVSTARGEFRTAYKSNAKEKQLLAELRDLGVEIVSDKSSDLIP
ncbi:MAG TPA: hypothetical protein VGR73_10205 [Bryobacteraceae bacterium]|nr:hypothetical protein [Bryobacteraceae bacterium]